MNTPFLVHLHKKLSCDCIHYNYKKMALYAKIDSDFGSYLPSKTKMSLIFKNVSSSTFLYINAGKKNLFINMDIILTKTKLLAI